MQPAIRLHHVTSFPPHTNIHPAAGNRFRQFAGRTARKLRRLLTLAYRCEAFAGDNAVIPTPPVAISDTCGQPSRQPASGWLSWKLLGAILLAWPALATPAAASASIKLAWDSNPESDIAGYTVYFGTQSGEITPIQNVGLEAYTVISGLDPSTTYYCRIQAFNTAGLGSDYSDEISFTTQSAAILFTSWAVTGNLSGDATHPEAMPFHDGVPNLLKYAFNLNHAGPDVRRMTHDNDTAGLPACSLQQGESQPCFRFNFVRRKASGLVYVPAISSDLQNFTPVTAPPTVIPIDGDWERVVVEQPCDPSSTRQLFGRVAVMMP